MPTGAVPACLVSNMLGASLGFVGSTPGKSLHSVRLSLLFVAID